MFYHLGSTEKELQTVVSRDVAVDGTFVGKCNVGFGRAAEITKVCTCIVMFIALPSTPTSYTCNCNCLCLDKRQIKAKLDSGGVVGHTAAGEQRFDQFRAITQLILCQHVGR